MAIARVLLQAEGEDDADSEERLVGFVQVQRSHRV